MLLLEKLSLELDLEFIGCFRLGGEYITRIMQIRGCVSCELTCNAILKKRIPTLEIIIRFIIRIHCCKKKGSLQDKIQYSKGWITCTQINTFSNIPKRYKSYKIKIKKKGTPTSWCEDYRNWFVETQSNSGKSSKRNCKSIDRACIRSRCLNTDWSNFLTSSQILGVWRQEATTKHKSTHCVTIHVRTPVYLRRSILHTHDSRWVRFREKVTIHRGIGSLDLLWPLVNRYIDFHKLQV